MVSALWFSLVISLLLTSSHASGPVPASISVNDAIIGNTSVNYLSVNFDWWVPGSFGSWPNGVSALTANLSDPRLIYLEDHVIYNVTGEIPYTSTLCSWHWWAGGTSCVLNATRWDEINQFAQKVGWNLVFGVSAMYGRLNTTSPWDPSNAEMLFRYTVEKGYPVYGLEFGNELMEFEGIPPEVLANDFLKFAELVRTYWPNLENQPKIIGPDSIVNTDFTASGWQPFLQIAGGVLDVVTYHMYLGDGGNPNLIYQCQTPEFLFSVYDQASQAQLVAKQFAPAAEVWAGESAMAHSSGQNRTTNAFASTLWYTYQLGALAAMNQKAFCRQSMLGGNYALVDVLTMRPNPDYYTAVLWKRLMGTEALFTGYDLDTASIRAFSMCSKDRNGSVVMAIINNGNSTTFNVSLDGIAEVVPRNEYRLTSTGLQSNVMYLNQNALELDPTTGDLPPMLPVVINANTPLIVQPLEVCFVEFPQARISSCY